MIKTVLAKNTVTAIEKFIAAQHQHNAAVIQDDRRHTLQPTSLTWKQAIGLVGERNAARHSAACETYRRTRIQQAWVVRGIDRLAALPMSGARAMVAYRAGEAVVMTFAMAKEVFTVAICDDGIVKL